MTEELIIAAIVLLLVVVVMLALVLRRGTKTDLSPVVSRLGTMEGYQERTERSVKEEIARNRQESAEQGRRLRDEVQLSLRNSTDSLVHSVRGISTSQHQQLEDFANQLGAFTQACDASASQLRLGLINALDGVKEEIAHGRRESAEQGRGLREEVQTSLKNSTDSLVQGVDRISAAQQQRLEDFANQLNAFARTDDASASQLRLELTNALGAIKESQDKRLSENAAELQQHFESFGRRLSEFSHVNQEGATQARSELSAVLKDFKDSLQKQMNDMASLQKQQMDSFAGQIANLTEKSEKKSDELRGAVEGKLAQLQSDNATRLEEMRRTVDEKLQGTLDKRLGESFRQVSDRLEQVHKGLGEMQTLAGGVGDLKRVLTNVKTRGTWGEVHLGNLLEQILTADQYARNVKTKPAGGETVDFAIKLPGPDKLDGEVVWLPIDAKFPKEDYERIVDASERGDAAGVEQGAKDLELRVRSQARDIRDKYLAPPYTTDFGLLYLPTEGLYAEVIRRPGLLDSLQREHRVVIVGPTTLAALLNSLQMGFRSLAIQKQSSEVWRVLGAVKTEFGKFGEMLVKVKKKLDETGNTIDDAVHRSRQMERKLRKVEALPAAEAARLLAESQPLDTDDEEPDETPKNGTTGTSN
jgi:DNA recombination protein RmuC